MTKKDYLEFLFFMSCTFFTLIIMDLIWGIDTGMSSYENCIVININDFSEMSFVDYFWVYGLYFLLGILPFGWSFVLYMLLKTKVPVIDKFFSPNKSKDVRMPSLKETYIQRFLFIFIIIPTPLIIYDLLLC
jgi:hypothetical protein